ncbi:MAG TPA: type II CAAX endopeptidase family protein [Mycobacteriales bacterium]|nr:type II CAAX endopeptidase family protein [Mycobacteriales bacterium]
MAAVEHEPAPGGRPVAASPLSGEPARAEVLRREVLLVLGLSLGAAAITAAVSFLGSLTNGTALVQQTATLVAEPAPGRPLLSLLELVVDMALTLVPVALVIHLLHRGGEGLRTIGFDARRPGRDGLTGAGLAAVIGGGGLALYLGARAAGVNLTVVPVSLPATWWRIPVLVLAAAQNGVLEEVIVVGYLLHRLRQLGWGDSRALAASAFLRGCYHLYQGLGGFAGNVVMGLIFGRIYQRYGRTTPLVVAHTLIDAVAFVGYVALVGRVSWLPAPRS